MFVSFKNPKNAILSDKNGVLLLVNISHVDLMVLYGPLGSPMVLYGLVWSLMDPYGPLWTRMVL